MGVKYPVTFASSANLFLPLLYFVRLDDVLAPCVVVVTITSLLYHGFGYDFFKFVDILVTHLIGAEIVIISIHNFNMWTYGVIFSTLFAFIAFNNRDPERYSEWKHALYVHVPCTIAVYCTYFNLRA